ncbi:molybdopterin-dependent oxidoreductase [Fuchsiella alkaliacetigena]|uniref:molybdopterin-dependent oxidoreductase n=1 Tax=Fuchsiella alkaliacetigena TaxID=957042 RepID=UPI00200A57D7|nr:molybdopterin-dependent oxidoreductase [Fuchsiella alkaliacetigena]MCK8823982.1 molybdopterin-dependent oxidoreductase [Fuchsiella alkaliacetigena]
MATNGNIGKPDINNSKFILYLGSYPGHAGKPMQAIARQAAIASTDGDLKFAVVDPVMAGGAVSPLVDNGKWIPIKPATDGAFVMAMVRWIIEHQRYNADFLSSPNLEAAQNKGFNSWSNAAHLIITDPEHPNYRKLLRAEDLGLDAPTGEDNFIVIDEAGKTLLYTECSTGDLLFEGSVEDKDGNSISVETGFVALKKSAFSYKLETYSQECGVPVETIIELAREFTSYGTKVATEGLGGTAAANGVAAGLSHYVLCALVGADNKKGGIIARRISFSKFGPGPRYKVNVIPDAPERKGMGISRTGMNYEDTHEYQEKIAQGEDPYPAEMPWHPVGNVNADNQALFSMINRYPYQAKILINWMANPLLAFPSADQEKVIAELKKTENLPLFISIDAFMAETTSLADYVIPDTTGYENWGIPNIEGNFSGRGDSVRWPVVKPATAEIDDNRYACFENFIIDVAKEIGVPGYGEEGILDANDNLLPLETPEDYFLRAITNVAYDQDPVPDIDDEEAKLQDLVGAKANWKPVDDILQADEWAKAAYVLSRGGRFEEYGAGYDGDNRIDGYFGCISIYSEWMASSKNSYNGEFFPGVITWEPEKFIDGTPISDYFPIEEWPFKLANYKAKFRSVTMMPNSPTLQDLGETNYIEINPEDAQNLGFNDGDEVKLVSATGGEVTGTLVVRAGVAKGTIASTFGYGHWQYGAESYWIDNEKIAGDSARGTGINATGIGLFDPTVDQLFGFSESVTGTPSRNGGAFRLEKL